MNDKVMTYNSYITNCHFFTEDDGCGHRDNRTLECHGNICPLLSGSREYVTGNATPTTALGAIVQSNKVLDVKKLQAYIEWAKHGTIHQRAVAVALESVGQEGAHHKQWIIDQMLRILCSSEYDVIMDLVRRAGLEWEEGIE